MSSLSSGIAAAPKLKQFLDESAEGQHSDISVVRVQIRGVDLVETGRKSGPANGDLTQLDELLVDDPAFLLLRANASGWYLVTWMPEGKVGVSNRMIYASSQSNLKAAVGFGNVVDSLQFSSKEEAFGKGIAQAVEGLSVQDSEPAQEKPAVISKPAPALAPKPALDTKPAPNPKPASVAAQSAPAVTVQQPVGQVPPVVQPKPQGLASSGGGVFVKKLDPRLAMSQSELVHMDLLKQEDDARNEQLQQMRSHFRTYTTPSKPDYDPNNQHANQGGVKQTVAAASGGFHT
ncbi:Twinfilin-1, partial [Linderina macrospora]